MIRELEGSHEDCEVGSNYTCFVENTENAKHSELLISKVNNQNVKCLLTVNIKVK